MKTRYLDHAVEELCFTDHKMGLISGPRQCGKTTLAKMLLGKRPWGSYFNWDSSVFRRAWATNPSALVPTRRGKVPPLLVLDEIHKDRRWKRSLKGVYDTLASPCDILVTGSARLDVFKKGSDSLLGRYYSFRLHPFSLRELHEHSAVSPDSVIEAMFSRARVMPGSAARDLQALLRFGPFPEPLLAQNARKARLWRQMRREIIVREDLRDISRIPELSRIELMVALLPERVGSLFSVNALREILEVSYDTVKRWLTYLKQLYYLYEVKPYFRSVPRALKKEGKIYFWDFGEVEEPAARIENLVANHLLKACHYWTDTGYGAFDLCYLRNKEKQEIDFLIVRDGRPWLPVEVKLNDPQPSPNWRRFLPLLPCRRGLQIVSGPHWQVHTVASAEVLVAGAAEALLYLV